jgi:hypothetical protein
MTQSPKDQSNPSMQSETRQLLTLPPKAAAPPPHQVRGRLSPRWGEGFVFTRLPSLPPATLRPRVAGSEGAMGK